MKILKCAERYFLFIINRIEIKLFKYSYVDIYV